MTDLRQAAQAVIDRWDSPLWKNGSTADAIADLRTALEQQQAEPVAWMVVNDAGEDELWWHNGSGNGKPLYTAPLQQQAEPVAYIHRQGNHWEVSERFLLDDEKARGWTEEPIYTRPPQRKPLTDEAIEQAQRDVWRSLPSDFDYTTSSWIEIGIRYAEAAHGIKEQNA